MQPTLMTQALDELRAMIAKEPIPVPEVSEATWVDFELADFLAPPAQLKGCSRTDTQFWINRIEPDLAFME